ncbi:hypothetical protein EVA_20386 [gut metagenome]|uniref:Uncharacterized protein n=1 Tax=gut metagenome TaxID=749906 RepID=J9FPJ3_9ZZZZ
MICMIIRYQIYAKHIRSLHLIFKLRCYQSFKKQTPIKWSKLHLFLYLWLFNQLNCTI